MGKVERILDQPVTLTVSGAPLDSRLSDHYGVEVRMVAPAGANW